MERKNNQSIMKTRTWITVLGAAALLCSCIPSVNPFYTDKDIAFNPHLVGAWQDKDKADNPDVWKFERTTNQAYQLTITDKEGKQGKFDARLFRLEQEYFLDLIPVECNYATNQADLVAFSMFPGHLLVRVPQIEPELKLALFDFDWLQKHLEKNPKALAHHREDDRLLLTAGTRDLQRFVRQHLGEGELFGKPDVMIRQTNVVSAAIQPVAR
jgi:hypothetical protein